MSSPNGLAVRDYDPIPLHPVGFDDLIVPHNGVRELRQFLQLRLLPQV